MGARLREPILLAILTIASLLPLLGKPIHLDDPVYLWTAEQIQSHPGDFFGFSINWHGTVAPIHEVNKNPPLVSYYFALVAGLVGWSELALHAGGLLIALFAVGGVYALARRLCGAPLSAAGVALATPAFVVSATTLMSDVLMLGLWCWAVYLWLDGMQRGSPLALCAAALAIAACALAKYFGAALIPLLFAYSCLREGRVPRQVAWLLLPIAVLVAYDAYGRSLYGHGLVTHVIDYASASRGRQGVPVLERCVTALSFTGGCLLTASLLAPLLWGKRALAAGAGLLLATPLLLVALGKLGSIPLVAPDGIRSGLLMQVALFAVAGVNVLALALHAARRERCNPESALLVLWVLGTFAFVSFFNWTVSARAILPMAPAVGILALRQLEARSRRSAAALGRRLAAPLLAGLTVSLAVAWADLQWAASGRRAAQELAAQLVGSDASPYFQGHWGFQYYIEPQGGRAYDHYRDHLQPGDWMVVPLNNSNVLRFPRRWAELVEERRFASSRWITLHSKERGAGFYSSVWGPLPFALGAAPDEVYEVQRVLLPIDPRPTDP